MDSGADKLRDSREVERVAADSLARRDGGTWTEGDEVAFRDWQNESAAHRVAVIRLKSIWQHADRLQALGAGVPAGTIPPPGQWRISPLVERRPKVASAADAPDGPGGNGFEIKPGAARAASDVAHGSHAMVPQPSGIKSLLTAAVLLAAVSGMGWHYLTSGANTYRTAIGDMQAVHLADGSQVTLNTDSRIHVALGAAERRIDLDRGEAFFDVAKDPARPFVVRAGNKRVVAVGTKFSVLHATGGARIADVRIVVTEGVVRVEDLSRRGSAAPVRLIAGNIARAGAAGVLVTENSVPRAEQTLSWRSGYIMLRDTALADAVAEFNRYNERQLVLADPALADLRIGGNLRLTNLEAFVRVLEQGFPIRADRDGERIVLSRR